MYFGGYLPAHRDTHPPFVDVLQYAGPRALAEHLERVLLDKDSGVNGVTRDTYTQPQVGAHARARTARAYVESGEVGFFDQTNSRAEGINAAACRLCGLAPGFGLR